MADSESFTMIEPEPLAAPFPRNMAREYTNLTSAPVADLDIQFSDSLRRTFPKHILVAIPTTNVNLLLFAALGNARAELNTDDEPAFRWRGYIQPPRGGDGILGDAIFFARYRYAWSGEEFIMYTMGGVQYILYPCAPSETPLSRSDVIDSLILAAGKALGGNIDQFIYVYDQVWTRNRALWEEVQKTSWSKVILDPKEKEALQEVAQNFFDSKDVYDQFGIPWKRGLIFYGPVGNGKTISTKALMHTLYDRKPPKSAVPTLYVKSAPQTYNIRQVFQLARAMAPCLLVMEDVETIVTDKNRSYFFNEVDGLENNDGILMIASTNYLDRLDPGLSKRPSRFDRKYLFPLPSKEQRTLYAEFWREKLNSKSSIRFPQKLCPAIANITEGFSFAYMQEAFVATLLVMAHDKTDGLAGLKKKSTPSPQSVNEQYVVNWIENTDVFNHKDKSREKEDLNKYKLWRVMQKQVEILRHDMDSNQGQITTPVLHTNSEPIHEPIVGEINYDDVEVPQFGYPTGTTAPPPHIGSQQDYPLQSSCDKQQLSPHSQQTMNVNAGGSYSPYKQLADADVQHYPNPTFEYKVQRILQRQHEQSRRRDARKHAGQPHEDIFQRQMDDIRARQAASLPLGLDAGFPLCALTSFAGRTGIPSGIRGYPAQQLEPEGFDQTSAHNPTSTMVVGADRLSSEESKESVKNGSGKRPEAQPWEMSAAGVGKSKIFTETAFESVSY